MFRLEQIRDCSLLSFQEDQAARWLMRSGGLSSNVNAAISFDRDIDPCLLVQCVEAACQTYDALRTRFASDEKGALHRLVLPQSECRFEFIELHSGDAIADPEVARQVANFCDSPFAFEHENWLRILLIRTADQSSVIAISMPHVISDANSIRLLMSGIWRDYARLAQGEALQKKTPRYSLVDFVGAQRAWADTADFKEKLEQLVDYAANGIAQARRELPAACIAPAPSVRPSTAVTCKLPEALCAGLETLAKRTQAGLLVTLISGAMLAQARIFQRRQLCFRLPFSNRVSPGANEIVGFLANDVPMFVSIDESLDCASFIRSIQRHSFSMMRFGAMPWAVLKERLHELPLMQSGKNPFEEYLINVFPGLENIVAADGYCAKPFPMRLSGFTSNNLKVWMQIVNGRIIISLRVGLEHKELAEQHYLPEFLRVFSAMAEHPDCCVGTIIDDIRVTGRACLA